jgi:enolase
MLNALGGGLHADNRLLVQEFMLVALSAPTFSDVLRMGADASHHLGHLLLARGAVARSRRRGRLRTTAGLHRGGAGAARSGDRVGWLSPLSRYRAGAGARRGRERTGGPGRLPACLDGNSGPLSAEQLITHWAALSERYPIVSLEDGLAENDCGGWRALTERLGGRLQLVGDDLFATHPSLLQPGIDQGIANAVLIKPNQVGTLTRTLETIALARGAGYASVMAHSSGDTEDTTIADLAVASGCRFIESGAPARSERTVKYNQLLRIEEQLGDRAPCHGHQFE